MPQEKQIEYCSRLQGKRKSKYCDIKFNKPLPAPSLDEAKDNSLSEEVPVQQDDKQEVSTNEETQRSYYDIGSNHEWAKKSNIKNIGEDIEGSARHKRNEDRDWDSVESLLSDKTVARGKVKAEMFDKIDPIDFTQFQKNETNLAEEESLNDLKRVAGLKLYLDKFLRKPSDGYSSKDYLEDFNALRNEVKNNKDNKNFSAIDLRGFAYKRLQEIQNDFRARKDSITPGERANFFNRQDAFIRFNRSYGTGKTSVARSLDALDMKNPEAPQKIEELSKIIKGKKFNNKRAPFVRAGEDIKESDFYKSKTSDAYTSNDYGIKNSKSATDTLTKDFSVRGIQFGNSMNDTEREKNLVLSARSFNDLSNAFGLSKKIISMNGTLALSYGARGKAGSVAHYEPTSNVLAFNKGTIGALAHEWSHALSKNISGGKMGNEKSKELLRDLKLSLRNGKIVNRIKDSETYKKMTYKKKMYWTDPEEVLARTFEKYTSMKLNKAGGKNNYLVEGINSELWPTEEEVNELSSKFDELLASVG